MTDPLIIAGREFGSRLFLGTGKFPSVAALRGAIEATGTEMVTVALRRIDEGRIDEGRIDEGRIDQARMYEDRMIATRGDAGGGTEGILDAIDPERVQLLVNTSGADDADEAIRLARLARAGGFPTWVKLEITPEPRYLLPDPVETLRAAEVLCAEGFTVLPYVNADPVLCKRLEEVGCATVMPLGSWIGSNQGLRTRGALEIIIEQSLVPVVVDAGIGAPSHASEALEMGADAVLVNTAVGTAGDPVAMGRAFRLAVEAGRMAFRAGLAGTRPAAAASSPLTGFLA